VRLECPMLAAFGLHGTPPNTGAPGKSRSIVSCHEHTPEGRIGVTLFRQGKPGVVLWLGSEDAFAAERLALHLETQVADLLPSPTLSLGQPAPALTHVASSLGALVAQRVIIRRSGSHGPTPPASPRGIAPRSGFGARPGRAHRRGRTACWRSQNPGRRW